MPIVQSATAHIMYHTTYFNLLKHQILEMETKEELEKVEYGMELEEKYQIVLDSIIK